MEHITNLGVEKESVVVVHDPTTGEIAHVHYVITAKGGSTRTRTPSKKTR